MCKSSLAVLSVVATLIISLASTSCSSKISSNSGELKARSDSLTSAAVTDVLSGSADYASIQARLAEAVALNRDNVDARVMLGVVVVLAAAQDELAAGGAGDLLLQRAGLVNAASGGSLWDLELEFENHGQGLFKNTTPTIGELRGYLDGTVRPVLDALLTVLDTVPSDWQYVIPAANGGLLLERLAPGQQFDLRLDYGDVQLAAAAGNALVAVFELIDGFDWNNLAPNDFDFLDNPNLDMLEVIRTQYPDLGHLLNPPALSAARDRLASAWQHYQNGSAWVRGENAEQQAGGLITLGRETFGDPLETQAFLATEAGLRTLVGRAVDGSFSDVNVLFDIDPFTGQPLPVEDQAEINFFRFFVGIDLRDHYFETVVDPLSNMRTFGVETLAELTSTMADFNGVVASIGGVAPRPGDLQELLYALRVDNPPVSTKIIDGNFTDWQSGALQVGDTPAAWLDQPAPDLGSHYIAVDNDYLYVYLDRDLTPFLTAGFDRYDFEVDTLSYSAAVRYHFGTGHGSEANAGAIPDYAHNGTGIEMRFPLASITGDWIELRRSTHADNSVYAFDSEPEAVFIKIR